MSGRRVALALFGAAPVAWFVFALAWPDVLASLGVLMVAHALIAWGLHAQARWSLGSGFALAALGGLWFYRGDFFAGLAAMSGGIYFVAALVGAVGAATGRSMARTVALAGLALAGLGWVVADGIDGLRWQLGNLLLVAGAGWLAWKTRDETAA